ncbi:hypothetical protein RND81_01G145400 [Saponaria officinalis]|uniref:VTT domain-containing protein n=1 Tax=Saponaria officinalis TaxID=3572 RepID=A0AAW1NFC4_SAPOF
MKMSSSSMANFVSHGFCVNSLLATTHFSNLRFLKVSTSFNGGFSSFSCKRVLLSSSRHNYLHFRIRSFQSQDAGTDDSEKSNNSPKSDDSIIGVNGVNELLKEYKQVNDGNDKLFLAKLAIGLGVAATVTFLSISLKQQNSGSSLGIGIQRLADVSPSSSLGAPFGFSFTAFGHRIVLPEYPPGWIYFWLLMAAGCGLFISEEALNIWVGTTLARKLCLDGTWQSFAESFSRSGPYIISTVLWVYWGVCISDMIPFYVGKLFRQSGASEDVCSKLGIGKEKLVKITRAVQKYGNLSGFVERFSLGVRNPTAFLAGTMGVSPECFFAGVCCGGLITLPIQLAIGFLLRERPLFAVATVASVVGIWTIFPYVVAASTALFFYLRQRYSS